MGEMESKYMLFYIPTSAMLPSDPANLSHLQLCGQLAFILTSAPVAPHQLAAYVSLCAERAQSL